MNNRFLRLLVLVISFYAVIPASAEDTDLFVGIPPSSTDLPNVLIILDNTGNWTAPFTNEIAAFRSAINALPPDKFRVGLMMFTETGGGNSNVDGGYIRAAIRTLDTDYKTKYISLIDSLGAIADKSNSGKAGKSMADAYYYFAGMPPYTGNNKNKTDYTGNLFGTEASKAIYALPGNALNSKGGTPYTSPVLPGSCAKNFIIYISNGAVQDANADNVAAKTELSTTAAAAAIPNFSATQAIATIPISPAGSQEVVADEWARFMKKSDLAITTYAIDVNKVTTGQGPGWTALLKSMAAVSSGKYFDVNSAVNGGEEIRKALETIFSEIQSVNSVFAAVSLPVSVNTQGTFLNQVFVGMFRPDQDGLPRWSGNLKQYKLGFPAGSSTLSLLDANGSSAINSGTGFIAECARSFWTPGSVDEYWRSRPQGGCISVANSDVSNYPDGNIVEKGAQAYVLRSNTARTVKTCTSAACSSLVDFDNANVTEAMLGVSTAAERNAIINWARGLDVKDEDIDTVTTGEMRMSSHGDVVHSRPVAINLGTDAAPVVVVFYGGNDGMLRAVNGNRSNSIGEVPAGGELWSFVPPEFHTQFKRLYDNNTTIKFPGNTATTPVPLPKPFAVDGAMTAHKSGSTAWLFATMRRGGRAVYGFDVSASQTPSLLWRIGPEVGAFADIGQSWSAPRVMKTAYNDGAPMLIFGGGYDTCEDYDSSGVNPPTPAVACSTPSSKGNKIYVADAQTGTHLKTFTTDRSVVADVFIVPDPVDTTGKARHAYAVDTGGNIYRIAGATAGAAFSGTDPANWTMTKIASLGCDTVTTCANNNRKFQHMPDVLLDEDGSYVLLIGSGDREKPLAVYTGAMSVQNHFFMMRDKPSDTGWLASEAANCGGNQLICLNSLYGIVDSSTPTAVQLATKPKGWYLRLAASEQVVTSAIAVFGNVTFSTHRPAVYVAGQCSPNLGTAAVFNINYLNAASTLGSTRSQNLVGGGLPPSPVAGMVILDNGAKVPFLIGGKPTSALEGGEPPEPPKVVRPKGRVYWQTQK